MTTTTLKPPGAYSSIGELHREAQAMIDRLMLEYCPDEMTPAQMENWTAHQRALAPDRTEPVANSKSQYKRLVTQGAIVPETKQGES